MTKNRFPPPAGTTVVMACAHKFSGPQPENRRLGSPPRTGRGSSSTSHGPVRTGARRREQITSIPDISGTKWDFPQGYDNPGGILFSVAMEEAQGYSNAPWQEYR
jgi:hypothetical protein